MTTNTNPVSALFQGTAPANVSTTTTATTGLAPGFSDYQSYLNNLANAGNSALAIPSNQLVAPLSSNQTSAFAAAPTAAQTYQAPLSTATGALSTAAGGITPSQINAFYNPNVAAVNKSLEQANQQNINTTVLPALQALGAQTGNTGSSRLLNATGQTLGGLQAGLLAQENTNNANAYNTAVSNALTEQGNLTNAANVGGNLAVSGQNAANSALTEQSTLGAQQQAQNQAIINAPLTQATNAAGLLKGYTVPTTSTTNYNGPASVYGPSQASQLLAAGSLLNSLPSGTLSGITTSLSNLLGGSSSGTVNTGTTGDTMGGSGASSVGTMDYSGSSTGTSQAGQIEYNSKGEPIGYYNASGTFVPSSNPVNDLMNQNNISSDTTDYSTNYGDQ